MSATTSLVSGIEAPPRPREGDPQLVGRFFTDGSAHPLDRVEWKIRRAELVGSDGEVVFAQDEVEVPVSWSQMATDLVAQKYFHGALGSPERESSVRRLVLRVVGALGAWGRKGGHLADDGEREVFEHELCHLLVHQMASFNSPVWFNLGLKERPQCSACFINSVEDSMPSILELARTEGMLFKYGSGSGVNLSPLRSAREPLAGGGTASGPVSFMRGLDAFAGVIKSGGRTRRAAKMVILDVGHPDILEFVDCKVDEERKARVLVEAGYDPGFDAPGGAYDSVWYQNANHSVRVGDEFMQAVVDDGWWETREVTTGEVADRHRAREVMRRVAEAAWACGDPGLQFDTTVNRWHTCPASGRINGSNPCSEYMFLDDSACNLASLNLLAFAGDDGSFNAEAFRAAVGVMILAQEIVVDFAHYPTERIAANSRAFRPLGLGYTNLGALLMVAGLPYDSDEGRALAGAVTALMTGHAYRQSARLAARLGPFGGFVDNRERMLEVVGRHREEAARLPRSGPAGDLRGLVDDAWNGAVAEGARWGFRNAQVTVLAPTGTISFMMDCDTTGVEPDLALVKRKRLVGGGALRLVNRSVPRALERLGYDEGARGRIAAHVDEHGTVEGAEDIDPAHLPVFDCAFRARGGSRVIEPLGHLRMVGAVQPFLSGAVSKTVNLPHEATPEEIESLLVEAWRLGLKAVSVYRDGCRGSQPVGVADSGTPVAVHGPRRRHLPDERAAVTHKFTIQGLEGYVTVGLYDDGTPGELFVTIAKEGSTLRGVMDAFATTVSMALQYGVPLESLVRKFSHLRFEPSGVTRNPRIPMASSLIDYIFRWLAARFLGPEVQQAVGVLPPADAPEGSSASEPSASSSDRDFVGEADAGVCQVCGTLLVRAGACPRCPNCGWESGCG